MQKFNVTIEQPMTVSFIVMAIDEQDAHRQGRELFEGLDSYKFRETAEFGTDAQIMIESEDGTVAVEWSNL